MRGGIFVAACSLLSALGAGCSSDPGNDGTQTKDDVLEIYSWWANPGEDDALNALLGIFRRKYPGTTVINASVSDPIVAAKQLETRMASGSPPDSFQTTGGVDLLRWVVYNGKNELDSKLDSVDQLAAQSGWANVVPKSIRDLLSFEGKMYGVPLSVARFSALFYNKQLFASRGLNPPTTLAEFYQVSEALKADSIIPLALGNKDSWPMTLLVFENVLVAKAGAEFRYSYLTGRENPSDSRITETLEEVSKILDYTNADRNSRSWPEAAQLVVDGKAAMTIMGDWAKGFFSSQGMRPDIELGELAPPGTSGTFVYIVNTFSLPKGCPNRQGATNFLNVMGSIEAQDAFNPVFGSIPPRTDTDVSLYDPLGRITIADFKTNVLTPAYSIITDFEFGLALDGAMKQFAADRDVSNVVRFLENHYVRQAR